MSKRRANATMLRQRAELKHDDPVLYDVLAKRSWAWRRVEQLARRARSEQVRLQALREFLVRTDPIPRLLDDLGPTLVAVNVQLTAPESDARAALPPGSVTVHLDGDERHGG